MDIQITDCTPEEFKRLMSSDKLKKPKKDLLKVVEEMRKITMKSGITAREMREYVHVEKK